MNISPLTTSGFSIPSPKNSTDSIYLHRNRLKGRETTNLKKSQILVIEDDYELLNALKVLRSERQWPLDLAQNSSEALAKLCSRSYDALILDWNLPDVSGDGLIKLTDALLEHHSGKHDYRLYSKTPVITFSSEKSKETRIDGSKYFYRTEHWEKPLKWRELTRKIETVVFESIDAKVPVDYN